MVCILFIYYLGLKLRDNFAQQDREKNYYYYPPDSDSHFAANQQQLEVINKERTIHFISTMNSVLLAAFCAVSASALTTQLGSSNPETLKQLFERFKQVHGREYSTMDEEIHRFNVFAQHLKLIDSRNSAENNGGVIFVM